MNMKDLSDESFTDEEQDTKSTVLHDEKDITGQSIFGFKTTKKSTSTPKIDKTVTSAIMKENTKTPYNMRRRIKKQIISTLKESDSDISVSGSEYEESDESEDSSTTDAADENRSSEDSIEEKPKAKPPKPNVSKTPSKKRTNKNAKYVIKTEEYFANNASKKSLTSNNTLDKLEMPRLPQDKLQNFLSQIKMSPEHEKALNKLSNENQTVFSKWMHILQENFNIVVYGLGSKRIILEQFQNEFLNSSPVIVVNGFFPSLTIKDILDSIIIQLLELNENPSNVYESCDLIAEEFSYIPDVHLYIIVHNIEGGMLRNGKAQKVLSRLSAVKNIHLIASIDHINAPLVWDHFKLSKFNFSWWDVTSFLPYNNETSFESSLLVQQSGMLTLSSLNNVFLSLTSNTKGIYLNIVKYQLKNIKNHHYQGMLFKELYSVCRESFLVSSDLALRAQLTEFIDHKLVKSKRAADGGEYLIIPINNKLLQHFLDEQNK